VTPRGPFQPPPFWDSEVSPTSFFPLPSRSFKDCIPRSFRRQIQQNNYLTKFRMKNVFKKFLRHFQRHTVGAGKLTPQDVMYKYLATLEQLAPRFGSELFPVLSLETSSEGEKGQLYVNGGRSPLERGQATLPGDRAVTHEVLVTGTGGIQWRPVPVEVGRWVGRAVPIQIPSHAGFFSLPHAPQLFLELSRNPKFPSSVSQFAQ